MAFFPRFHFHGDRLSTAALLRADDPVGGGVQPLPPAAEIEADCRPPEPEPEPSPSRDDVLGAKINLTWVDISGRLRPVWWVDANWWLDAAWDDPGWPSRPRARTGQKFGKSWQ